MGKPKIRKHQVESVITAAANRAKQQSTKSLSTDNCMLISLKHLDMSQGDTLDDWDQSNMLAGAMSTLHGYSSGPIASQARTTKFTIYGNFPPKEKTKFTHPKHIPEDAEWARIHVTGLQCVIGHIVHPNTFYVVFLDGKHEFYISELKNT